MAHNTTQHNTTHNTQHTTHNTQHTTQQRGLVEKVVWCVFPLSMPKSAKFGTLDAGGTQGGTRGGRGEVTPYLCSTTMHIFS